MPNRSDSFNPLQQTILHCSSKCVRGMYLMGKDRRGNDFEHRKKWVEERVAHLANWFGIDVVALAILATHFHLVLRNLPELVARWSDKDVIRRACKIFPLKFERLGVIKGKLTPQLLNRFVANKKLVREMRLRLSDTSWFMRQLNQNIARRANEEDEVGGHFFGSRFRSRVVTDDLGALLVSIYVDLSPIRAAIAETPETSTGTSAYQRIKGAVARKKKSARAARHDEFLCPISTKGDGQKAAFGYHKAGTLAGARASDIGLMEMSLEAYLELLDWVGRQVRRDKRGKISASKPPILDRIGLSGKSFVAFIDNFDDLFRAGIGSASSLRDLAEQMSRH